MFQGVIFLLLFLLFSLMSAVFILKEFNVSWKYQIVGCCDGVFYLLCTQSHGTLFEDVSRAPVLKLSLLSKDVDKVRFFT